MSDWIVTSVRRPRSGHVVLAPDLFKPDDNATRTWFDERIPLEKDEYRHRKAPRDSAIVPHAVASLEPALMTDYVCRIRDQPLDRAVETLLEYL